MDLGLKGKKAFIMASSKGLGKGVALELAKEGADVLICGRNEKSLKKATEEIKALNKGKVDYVVGDVSSPTDRAYILEFIKTDFGSIDILVTNSGGPPTGLLEEHSLEQWETAYRNLLESAVGILKGVLPEMKQQKWGRIISITSQAVKQPVKNLVLSNAVRASVVGLVKTLANELGQYNITVNNVMPGYTETERLQQLIAQNSSFSNVLAEIPLGRIGKVDEFAAAVTFLASERASYITGISLPIDGGWIKSV